MTSRLLLPASFALLGLWSGAWAQAVAGPASYAVDVARLELLHLGGVTSQLQRLGPDQGGPAMRVIYSKTGPERRLVAAELRPTQPLGQFRALDLRYRLAPAPRTGVRFALLAYERGGGVWFRSGHPLAAADEFRECRFPLQGMRQTAFSQDASGQLEWDQIERLWVGVMVDGEGDGSFEFAKLLLTSETYRATEAVSLFRADAAQWSVGADPAVDMQPLELVEVEGAKCLRLRFRFPGGRHMYYVPAQPLDELEYSAYEGLRFTYRATLPAGVSGLLVCVVESGGQFVATPPPEATNDWVSVTVPWSGFPLGAWSKDDNGHLDIDAIERVCVGAHGTATGEGGEGEILIRAIDAVPAAQ